ncbi:hypothetical protein C8Q76DRAFT_715316 [Earliella scabrosa]|nr:hypothetical protein C8Q76DRAFT_715316 [Earliella scabrosa]
MNATLSDSNAQFDRDGTIGVGYLGVALASVSYGVTCIQTILYFHSERSRNDPWYIRAFVAALWILDSFREAVVIHSHYGYLITHWGDMEALQYLVWSIPASVFVNTTIFILVRCFFLRRIWLLSRNLPLTLALGSFAVTRWALTVVYFKQIVEHQNIHAAEMASTTMAIYLLSFEVATTALFTATLLFYLYRGRSGMQRSNSIVSRIARFFISTSMLSTMLAIANLVSAVVAPTKQYKLFFDFLLETVDANVAIATLNLREVMSNAGEPTTVHFNTFPLGTFQSSTDGRRDDGGDIQGTRSGVEVTVKKTTYVV